MSKLVKQSRQSAELAKIAAAIRTLHPEAKRYFSNFCFARFAIGCYLLRARAVLPDLKRGPTVADSDAGEITFTKWKKAEFADIGATTLYNYQMFASRVIERFPELERFDPHRQVSDTKREEILEQLKSCIDGKEVTLSLRAMGEIPDATPPGGDRGGRRPKKDMIREATIEQQRATEVWRGICTEIEREASLQSWKILDAELRRQVVASLSLVNEITAWENPK